VVEPKDAESVKKPVKTPSEVTSIPLTAFDELVLLACTAQSMPALVARSTKASRFPTAVRVVEPNDAVPKNFPVTSAPLAPSEATPLP